MARDRRAAVVWVVIVLLTAISARDDGPVTGASVAERIPTARREGRDQPATPIHERQKDIHEEESRTVSKHERADAIVRAGVWRQPKVPVSRAALNADPKWPSVIDCWFRISEVDGTTPKFHCLLETGKEVRTKYGLAAEIPAEAAATRLLSALGFGADTVMLVERLRCYGCPKEPFVSMRVVEITRTRPIYEHLVNHSNYEEFPWAAMEAKLAAPAIETEAQKGWAFFELDSVDPTKGGAPRAHVDALRLVAVFLAHWDNKAENQRLVCLSTPWPSGTRCKEPFLMLQDVGATFGPNKVDLSAWERAQIWEDRATCTISMRPLPYGGGTFGAIRISERGRRFFATLVGQLTDRQLTDLFAGARFDKLRSPLSPARPVSEWVNAFKKRVRTISDGPQCPDA